jgi:hydroxymethylbilane synthase
VYPIILDMRKKRAVVVGGGAVAERKVVGLLDAQADVVCVALEASAQLEKLAAEKRIRLELRAYRSGDLDGATLAFATTDDAAVNDWIVADARASGVLVNDATAAERGDFSTPATVRAGSLLLTVDTGGNAPALVKQIRDELAERFDARYARATDTLGRMREYVQTTLAPARRAEVLRRLARLDVDVLAKMNPSASQHAVDELVATLDAKTQRAPVTLVCASRGSKLAMRQTRETMARLAEAGIASTLEIISTTGDRFTDRPIEDIGTENVFVHELELALRHGRADYAVHSCKDLPGVLPDDMDLVAITKREDPRDAFCSERFPTFNDLPSGARVGTSSPRRRAQLARLRPDLRYDDVRGNVDTRLGKLTDDGYDAIVLAMAGLRRLGAQAKYTVAFDPKDVTPAVGQGALAIEMRAGDTNAERLHEILTDEATELAVLAERAFLRAMRGGCHAPIGGYGSYEGEILRFHGVAASLDGTRMLRGERVGIVRDRVAAEQIGEAVAAFLLENGAAGIIADRVLTGRLFLLPRTQERPSRIASSLREAGAEVVEAPDSASAVAGLSGRLPDVILFPSSGSVAAIADYLGGLPKPQPTIAAMGPSSAAAAQACGFRADVVSPNADIPSFVQAVTRHVLAQREESPR